MLDLSKIGLQGELTLDTPSGGRILVSEDAAAALKIAGSNFQSLRDLIQLSRAAFPNRSLFSWLRIRNPIGQPITIFVDTKELLYWPAGERIQVKKLVQTLRLIIGLSWQEQ